MRIIKFYYENGYVSGNLEEVEIYGSQTPDSIIDSDCRMNFEEFCEDYAYLAQGYPWENLEDGDFEDEEEMIDCRESYYEGCECGWEEITIEELKEWCSAWYGDFETRYAPIIENYTKRGI